jgi:hypothetical protein
VASVRVVVKIIEAIGQSFVGRPQMMVRIDDPAVGVDDLLGNEFRPFLHDGSFNHASTMAHTSVGLCGDVVRRVGLH